MHIWTSVSRTSVVVGAPRRGVTHGFWFLIDVFIGALRGSRTHAYWVFCHGAKWDIDSQSAGTKNVYRPHMLHEEA